MMTKDKATENVKLLWEQLNVHCQCEIAKIEAICDKHGITHYFRGLPPFGEYGNSGHYFPTNPETGEGWLSSEAVRDDFGYYSQDETTGWISSNQGC